MTTMADPHVLVLVDTSPASEAALDNAARLARHHRLDLIALFVEDQDLIASAGHRFSREISLLSGQARLFDREMLQVRLERQRQQIQARLASLDQHGDLRWRFDVVTGSVIEKTRQAALEADWVVLGKAGWSATRGGRLGATARQLVETTRSRLFLWQGRAVAGQIDIAALIADPENSGPVIETARQLALATEQNARLLLLPDADSASLPAMTTAGRDARPSMTIERLNRGGIDALRHALQVRPAVALVIDDRIATALNLTTAELISELDTPVIRVSTPATSVPGKNGRRSAWTADFGQ